MEIYMGMLDTVILEQSPSASPDKIAEVAVIWEEVVRSIINKMLEYSAPHIDSLHINLREEMCLELANLTHFISTGVVKDRLKGRSVEEIDVHAEREQCFNQNGLERISNTAKIYADRVWIKLYNERWKPKTVAALEREKNPKHTKLSPKPVTDNHFIPKSFITRYWAEGESVLVFNKEPNGQVDVKKKGVGQWGYVKNLYSDHLEAYFGLLEGDAVRPLKMLLNVEPLNRPQKEALVGFIVVQSLRNPHFMERLRNAMVPIVTSTVGEGQANDKNYMQAVYESLYSQNEFYDKVARPVLLNRWVVVRSEKSVFVLPDVCNIMGTHGGNRFAIMPITPRDCLIVLPISETTTRIIPYYIKASPALARDISNLLVAEAEKDFLGSSSFQIDASFSEDPKEILVRVIQSLTDITNEENARLGLV